MCTFGVQGSLTANESPLWKAWLQCVIWFQEKESVPRHGRGVVPHSSEGIFKSRAREGFLKLQT